MAKLFNRAKMTTTTTGSGTITLGSASNGFQSFADAGVADGDVVQYVIEEGANFEIGTGTYSATGTSLTRTPSESSNSNNAITLAGQATVSITATHADFNRLQHGGSDKVTVSSTGASVSGNLAVSGTVDGVDISARDAVLTSTTTTANAALPKAGGTMTGNLTIDQGTAGDAILKLRSDTDNNNEGDHPSLELLQDGDLVGYRLGIGATNSDTSLADSGNGFTITNTTSNGLSSFWWSPNNGGNAYKVFHDNYHPNADKWTTSRTLSLTGGVTGSVSWDGSANASLTSTVALATASAVGGIKIGYTENGKNYPVELSSGKAFVNVPWTDTNTNQLTTFVVQDGDSTNVTMGQGKYLKFAEGGAIDVNFTDTSTGSSGDPYDLTISHADTSSQGSVNNSNGTVIQDVTLDTYGHVTGLNSLDGDARWVNVTGDTMTGNLTIASGNSSALYLDNSSDAAYDCRLQTAYDYDGWFRVVDGNNTVRFSVGRDNIARIGGVGPSANKVFHDGYHPNADKWTTARSHTVTLTGAVSGTASQTVDGTGNKTWSIATSYNDNGPNYIDVATGNYGTVKVDDDRGVTWAGYAVRDDWVLMFNGAERGGIYNDTDNEWALQVHRNAQTELYHNGSVALATVGATGIRVGSTTSSDIYMQDTDHGERRIHCNSNAIGFLNSSNSWSFYSEDSGRVVAESGIRNKGVLDMGTDGSLQFQTNSNGGYIPHPRGGSYVTSTGGHTGAIKIKFPTHGTADMLTFHVDIFDYATNESVTLYIAGYLYQTTGNNEWVNCEVINLSGNTGKDYTVRFGADGSENCVWIGETNSTWSYPQVLVRDLHVGYTANVNSYDTGFEISFVTSFDTIDETHSNNFPIAKYAQDADKLDGLTSSSFIRSDADDNVGAHTEWQDNYQVRLGNGADFRMWHDGTNTYFRNFNHSVGSMYFQGEDAEGTNHGLIYMECGNSNPYVRLFQNGGERLRTLSGGVGVTGLTVGDVDANPHNSGGLQVKPSVDEKIVLSGSSNPYIRWQEGTTDKAYIQWNSGGWFDFRNQENGQFKFQSTVDGQPATIYLVRHDTTTASGNHLGEIAFSHTDGSYDPPYAGSSQYASARIVAEATETMGSGDDGSRLDFWVKPTDTNKNTASSMRFRMDQNGNFHADGTIISNSTTTSSDIRLKEDVKKIDDALQKVKKLNGYTFNYTKTGAASAGVIAQEVEKVLPSAVIELEDCFDADDDTQYKHVEYDQLHGLLIEAIKEQQTQIDALTAQVEELKRQ